MKRRLISSVTVILLCAASGIAQSRDTRPGTATDIRKIDFLDFTYPSSLCSREYGKQGIGKSVRVRKGEFKNRNAYFAVDQDAIVYGDVSGDGQDDAVVVVNCGGIGANYSRCEFYVYSIKSGRAALLAEITDRELERDYRHFYPETETYWGPAADGLKIADGKIEIDVLADGPHAAPQHVATMVYRLGNGSLSVVDRPQRRDSSQ